MSVPMLPRQRVLAALDHQEPDRVPLALGGGPYGVVDDLYLRLVQRLGLEQPVPPFRSGHNISYMDDRLLEKLGTDIRYCWPGLLPNSPVIPGERCRHFLRLYGQVWKRALPYYYAGEGSSKMPSAWMTSNALCTGLTSPIRVGRLACRARPQFASRDQLLYYDAHGCLTWTFPDRLRPAWH